MKKNNKGDTKKIRVWGYVSPELEELVAQRAKDENNTKSDIVTKALTLYLAKELTDESLLIAKMGEVARVVQNLSTRLEAGQKLDLEWYHYNLMFTPELPKDEKERNLIQQRAAKRASEFLLAFRRRVKRMPQFLETIFGVMLEADDPGEGKDGRP
ncbi:MAG: hypothetical protein LBK83_00730 [Treponema sp.]|jgi:hypothetical protein|nr:hypothetical protein [Treponema sp.]